MNIIFLHRLAQSILLPPFTSITLILVGIIIINKKLGKVLIILALIILYIESLPIVAYSINRYITPPPMLLTELKKAQAIIILGGGINTYADEYNVNAVSNSDTFTRIRYGAFLAKKAANLPIFVSGGAINTKDSEASLIKKSLINEFNVNNKIILEPDSKNTRENAKYTARLLQQYGITKAILVTQASHMRRAKALFEQNGIQIIPAPTGFYSLGYNKVSLLWFIPSAGAMSTVSTILHELFGYLYDLNF